MSFLFKLYELTNEQPEQEGIQWSDDGTFFCVLNPSHFACHILPRYYKHNNYASFVRQLNVYGFKRSTKRSKDHVDVDEAAEVFKHPYFRRGQHDLLVHVRRRHPGEQPRAQVDDLLEDILLPSDDNSDLEHVKAKCAQLEARYVTLTSRSAALKNQLKNIVSQDDSRNRELTQQARKLKAVMNTLQWISRPVLQQQTGQLPVVASQPTWSSLPAATHSCQSNVIPALAPSTLQQFSVLPNPVEPSDLIPLSGEVVSAFLQEEEEQGADGL